jgi:Holliday junction resolvase RusA-like endonuclease
VEPPQPKNLLQAHELEVPGAGSAFCFPIPDGVQSKSNFRRQRRGGDWGRLSRFEDLVATYARAARPTGWVLGDPDLPVAKRPGVVAVVWARTMLDAGNLSKSVLDALEGVVYVNDNAVRAVVELAERGRSDQSAVVALAQLPPDASPLVVAEVTSALLAQLGEILR